MSVVGIDFGAQSTKIGVARNKGIDIVRIACPTTFLFLFLPPSSSFLLLLLPEEPALTQFSFAF